MNELKFTIHYEYLYFFLRNFGIYAFTLFLFSKFYDTIGFKVT
ncbi:hypothetical protein HH_0781 [Helicobacter hepaticus ATCC 51449]|uniref:Uncharacterized protein n=1 Tax=Helicobacter hepaticus (strain ATCC 51449 / 3B1) TaxID=235279 RepID=Q7VI27_HELHP|nr:hypothetical protein HH_0781 [Helicobacter hepaticus ATCC 51449]